MQDPTHDGGDHQPPNNRKSLSDHDDWWNRIGSRQAFVAWLQDANPNLAIHLVPQSKSLTARHVTDIGTRWCNRVQKGCFGRNPRRHQGRFILFAEYSDAVGWHIHGVGALPPEVVSTVSHSGEEWLREQSDAYLGKTLPPQFDGDNRHTASALIHPLSTEADRDRTINYAVKEWSAHGKWDRVVLSGCHSPRA